MDINVTLDINAKVHDEVKEIRALAVKKFNTRNNTNWPEVITVGRFFEQLEYILVENWYKFDSTGIPEILKNELANMMAVKISAPSTFFSFLYTSLYIDRPGELIGILEAIINEYDPVLQEEFCKSRLQ